MAKRTARKDGSGGGSPRFDVAALRNMAGQKVFARGVDYHRDGQVEIGSITATTVLAKVIGSELYRAELHGTGTTFSGKCTCPAFSDWGFCKHLVATALTTNDLSPEALERSANRFSKIRDFLRAKGTEPLVDMIMNLAERDSELFADLELSATEATADDQTLFAQLKKMITAATRTGGLVEYHEAREWAQGVERIVDRIASLVAIGRPALALRLLDYIFERMDQALDTMDDSEGDSGAVYSKACDVHVAAACAARPDPIALARQLFDREVNSPWEFFYGASGRYEEALGDVGLAEYRRLASEAWQAIKPARRNRVPAYDEQDSARFRLRTILDGFATRDDDVDAQIAIRATDLSTAYAYLEIARLCLDHDREADALKWAEDGLWQFEDAPDERLVFFTADLYRQTGRAQGADELLWTTFERLPSIELYRRVKAAAGKGKAALDAAGDRAIALLKAKLDKPASKAHWSSPRELLLQILTSERRFDEAWSVVQRHGCINRQLLDLARLSEQSHPHDALQAYIQEAERLATSGGRQNYAEAAKLLVRMQSIRAHLGLMAEHAAFIAAFVTRHKAKKNLMTSIQSEHSA